MLSGDFAEILVECSVNVNIPQTVAQLVTKFVLIVYKSE